MPATTLTGLLTDMVAIYEHHRIAAMDADLTGRDSDAALYHALAESTLRQCFEVLDELVRAAPETAEDCARRLFRP